MSGTTLSVVVITLNEEQNLGRCLNSVSFANEIVVVDSGSKDRTTEIARQFTDKVLFHKMEGFGSQKQFALDQATGDWILSLDADEWVSDELRASLTRFLSAGESDPPYHGYLIYRRNIFLGRPMTYCGWYVPILRLLRKGHGHFNEKLVHEEILIDGPAGIVKGDIVHEPYKDILHHLRKMQQYAALDAKEVLMKDQKVTGGRASMHLILRPLLKFVQKYVLQQGFREGIHGLILSCMAAIGVFLIYAQCWHLQRQRMNGRTE